jgi:hypothetical protein
MPCHRATNHCLSPCTNSRTVAALTCKLCRSEWWRRTGISRRQTMHIESSRKFLEKWRNTVIRVSTQISGCNFRLPVNKDVSPLIALFCSKENYRLWALNRNSVAWAESASEPYRPSDRRLSAKLMPTIPERRCYVVTVTDPYDRTLDFLHRSRYFFFQVAPQFCSRGWVDPVPDPQLLRKSGSAWNRTRDLWICSQGLWPLDHRGGPLSST